MADWSWRAIAALIVINRGRDDTRPAFSAPCAGRFLNDPNPL
jgi:hypothetical protein